MNDRHVSRLPEEVRDLALRLGARSDDSHSAVLLTQLGTMSNAPSARAIRFRAQQAIDLVRPAFVWRASAGPFGCISVVDALTARPNLEVRLFGLLRLVGLDDGPDLTKGELMRYLAELAWAPDAILKNSALSWKVTDAGTFQVSAAFSQACATVELKLDADGRIAAIDAPDRPRREGGRFVSRPWRGRFFDYRRHENRWLPFQAEVGWFLDGQLFVTWRGELMSWRLQDHFQSG